MTEKIMRYGCSSMPELLYNFCNGGFALAERSSVRLSWDQSNERKEEHIP